MTRNPDFKGTPLFDVISQKRYKTETHLQWKRNRNSYAVCRMMPLPMILSDPNLFQGHDILYSQITRKYVQDKAIFTMTN